MWGLGWGRLQPSAEGEGRRAGSKRSPIFAAFLEMRCKYIHYSVIPLMKTDKHFCRSETYFSINFNMETQAQGAQCGDPSGSQGLGCLRHLLLGPEVTVVTCLLRDWAGSIAQGLRNPATFLSLGLSPELSSPAWEEEQAFLYMASRTPLQAP